MIELALTLLRRDGLSQDEALEIEQEARAAVREVLLNLCGLEPD